jgi:hypothetical protein
MIDMMEEYGTSREADLGEKGIWGMLKKRLVERALAGEVARFELDFSQGNSLQKPDSGLISLPSPAIVLAALGMDYGKP